MKYLAESKLSDFLDFLEQQSIKMVSCTENEISEIENLSGKRLPQVYLDFMRKAGAEFSVFAGSSYTLEELPLLKKAANELLGENNVSEKITDNMFVFLMHQGYQFVYFNLEENENPPVYYYGEGEGLETPIKVSESFIGFLIEYYNEIERLQ